jgi:hypothetical protein
MTICSAVVIIYKKDIYKKIIIQKGQIEPRNVLCKSKVSLAAKDYEAAGYERKYSFFFLDVQH